MKTSTIKVPIRDVAPTLKVQLKATGVTEFKVRVWLATQIFKLAALVASPCLEIEVRTEANR